MNRIFWVVRSMTEKIIELSRGVVKARLQWNNSDRLSLEFQKAADSTFFLMRPGPLPQSG